MSPQPLRRFAALAAALASLAVVAVPAGAHDGPPTQPDVRKGAKPGSLAPPGIGMFGSVLTSQECTNGLAGAYPCKNVDMASFVPLPGLGLGNGNDIWGWTDETSDREFAIMGTSTGTGFVEVTDPENPRPLGVLPTRGAGAFVLWRDVKVDGHHAFIVSEIDGSGLQVFDLTRLLDAEGVQTWDADATYDGFSSAHNISINERSDTAYVVGSDTCGNGDENGGLLMVDISDPVAPKPAGCAIVDDDDGDRATESNNYVHDAECVIYAGPDAEFAGREICFGFNENAVVIYDVTDKAKPEVLSVTGYDTAAYTHQGSLTADQRWVLFGDEIDEGAGEVPNTTTYIMDASDLRAPKTPTPFFHDTKSIDHNMYVHGNRVFQSNYAAGLRILEFDDERLSRSHLDEVAYFDVVPFADPTEYAGTWSNYRFPGSGTVVVSTIENAVSGLFVLQPRLDGEAAASARSARAGRR